MKPRRGPIFVDASINGCSTKAAIVSGATHNVLSVKEAARLCLPLSPCDGWIKGPFSDWEPLAGAARKVSLRVGSWVGLADFMIFPMDALDAILGMDFLFQADVDVYPARNGIYIKGGERPEFVESMAGDQVDRPLILTLEIRLRGEEDPPTKP